MDTTSDSMLRTNFHQNGIGMAENVLFFFNCPQSPNGSNLQGHFLETQIRETGLFVIWEEEMVIRKRFRRFLTWYLRVP